MKKALTLLTAAAIAVTVKAQDATITLQPEQAGQVIPKEIYGQFAEHLGSCIYGGLWVGENSPIPNINGYRKDVFEALKELHIPVLRWPGGCFADEYHWRDGIGPRSERPSMKNNNWGGTIEDNSFGTHEFLNLCEMLGCEPYVSGNVGSGTVEELAKWVEYMTSEDGTPMAKLRKQNGREKPWRVKYLGVGNESWGCGGNMHVEYYADLFRRYATYCRDYDGNRLYRIASGANEGNVHWTKVLMDKVGRQMAACSVHYYTVTTWNGPKGQATEYNNDQYYWTLNRALYMDNIINMHDAEMSKRDPQKRIGLLVDEWGTWWDEEPGTIKGHLYQQNCMRDAMVAALTLNIFHRHTDRVKMANIAQVVNVLQSMILTDQVGTGHMVLTPTYHVFRMFTPFQEATYVPMQLQCDDVRVTKDYNKPVSDDNYVTIPAISASAAKAKDGSHVVALANVLVDKAQEVKISLGDIKAKQVTGTILASKAITDYNDFEHPTRVKPAEFKGAKLKKGELTVKLPAQSIVVLSIN